MLRAEMIDRKLLKSNTKELLRSAQVAPKAMFALYAGLVVVLNLVDAFAGGGTSMIAHKPGNMMGIFVTVLTGLLGIVLMTGFVLYCMAIRRGERGEFLTLFDGFSFVGKLIGLHLVEYFFVFLWSLLFVIPGIIAVYRYRFALYNLCETPELGVFEALDMSKRQTQGYKGQLFLLDLSYFGWALLAVLPIGYASFYTAMNLTMPISSMLYSLVLGLWNLVVGLFYMPVVQCVDLDYYDVAVRTSGISAHTQEQPPQLDEGSSPF